MMTSVLLVDVQGFEALAKGQANPVALISELSHTMHGMTRQIAVMRAYCSNRVSSYRRTAYREAGFEIIETAGPDETLIRISVDLHKFATSTATYEEAIMLGGTTDYTGLARIAREHLMMVSVVDHPTISSALEALADGLVDLEDLDIDRSASIAPAPSFKSRDRAPIEPLTPRTPLSSRSSKADNKAVEDKPELDHPEDHKPDTEGSDGDAWPDPKSGSILVAGAAAGAGAAALMSSTANGADTEDASGSDDAESDASAKDAGEAKADSVEAAADVETDTDTKAEAKTETATTEADIEAELEDALTASLSDDLADSLDEDLSKSLAEENASDDKAKEDKGSDFGDDLDAELEAELTAELVPDLAAGADDGAAEKTNANGAHDTSDVSVDDDSTIDALFADIAGGDDKLGSAQADTTAVDPAVTAAPVDIPMMADAKADADVDQLLSRLMSDDLAGDAEPKKAELDVVPER